MAVSVCFDNGFIRDVKVYAEAARRSIPEQIEHWVKVGRIAEDNPELPYSFIRDISLAQAEIENDKIKKYVRRTVIFDSGV